MFALSAFVRALGTLIIYIGYFENLVIFSIYAFGSLCDLHATWLKLGNKLRGTCPGAGGSRRSEPKDPFKNTINKLVNLFKTFVVSVTKMREEKNYANFKRLIKIKMRKKSLIFSCQTLCTSSFVLHVHKSR